MLFSRLSASRIVVQRAVALTRRPVSSLLMLRGGHSDAGGKFPSGMKTAGTLAALLSATAFMSTALTAHAGGVIY